MATLIPVQVIPGVYRPTNNLGYAMPGDYPVGIIGAYTFGGTLAASLVNEVAGVPGALPNLATFGLTAPTVFTQGIQVAAGCGLALPGGPIPLNPSCAIVSIFEQPASTPNPGYNLGGYYLTNTAGSLALSVGAVLAAVTNAGGSTFNRNASFARDGGARTEFIAASFDASTKKIALQRPRTSTRVETVVEAMPVVTENFRALGNDVGNTGTPKAYRLLVFSRAPSEIEFAALYLKEKAKATARGLST